MQKRFSALAVLLPVLSLLVAACSLNRIGCQRGTLRVGMVSDVGGMDDNGLNEGTWLGLQRARDELNVCTQFFESRTKADYEKNISGFAEQDFDLIIAVGSELTEAMARMAERYPAVKFAMVDDVFDPPLPNTLSITFSMDEVAFLAGYLAAAWADLKDPADPQAGWIGAMQIPQVEQLIVAYEAGVAYYNQQKGRNIQVKGAYVGDFEAPNEGRVQGNALIDRGVDVLLGVGGKSGSASLVAAGERGKWGIGTEVDQYIALPNERDVLLTSCLKRYDNAAFAAVEAANGGEFLGGGVYVGALANQGLDLAPFRGFENEIPDNIKEDLEEIRQGIIEGSIDTGW